MFTARNTRNDEQGFVFALFACSMLFILAIAGFSVDLGAQYLTKQRLQNAADAAALAGAVYLPQDPTTARNEAIKLLNANTSKLVRDAIPGAVIAPESGHPTFLKVTLSRDVPTNFAALLGVKSLHTSATATGEFRHATPMGSATNLLGQEPDGDTKIERADMRGLQNRYWLNISAAGTDKSTGDRYSSGGSDDNAEYSEDGQDYILHVDMPGTITLQAFDPAFIYQGDHCDQGASLRDQSGRYAKGDDNPHCTGDQMTDTTKQAPATTYSVLDAAKQPICTQTFPGYKVAPNPYPTTFRTWVTLCNRYLAKGDYTVRVSNVDDTRYNGLNRFALRANSSAGNTNVTLYAAGRVVVFSNDRNTAGDVQFYIARVDSAAAGQTMTVELFDIADADGGVSALTVLPAKDANVSSFGTGATKTNLTSSQYNGKTLKLTFPIPANYTCADANSAGCWARIQIHYNNGDVQDTTSWSAGIEGAPLHLVQ